MLRAHRFRQSTAEPYQQVVPEAPQFFVRDLPADGREGMYAYAKDGRKNGEPAGEGTGVMVFHDGRGWIACDTGATVAA